MTLEYKPHRKSWCHVKIFSVECEHWTLFRNKYAAISDKNRTKQRFTTLEFYLKFGL